MVRLYYENRPLSDPFERVNAGQNSVRSVRSPCSLRHTPTFQYAATSGQSTATWFSCAARSLLTHPPRPSLTQVAHVAREGPPGSSGKMGGQLQCGAGRRARAAPLVIYEGEDLNALKLPRPEPCTCVAFPD